MIESHFNSISRKGRKLVKALRYSIILMILVQLVLPWIIPLSKVYPDRMDFNITQNNVSGNIDAVLEKIKMEINQKHLKDYLILLGDSVLYGSPGASVQAPNVFMENLARKSAGNAQLRIFNLSYPSMQSGDIYTMLLKLDKAGISTQHVMMNFRYASFVPRVPDPKVVFWLERDLKSLDPAEFKYVLPHLQANGYKEPAFFYGKFMDVLYHDVMPAIKLHSYKDYLIHMLQMLKLKLTGHQLPDDHIINGDLRPWYVKGTLEKYVQGDIIKRSYSDVPFNMTDSNIDIHYIEKILQHQKGKDTFVVMNGANQTLMKQYVEKPGYQENLKAIDRYFQQKEVRYLNLEGKLADTLFTDHTHFTAEGYEAMAALLWQSYAK
jgi:hypothetical protein